jgi:hypothetical protein
LATLQQIFEKTSIKKECHKEGGTTTILVEEVETAHPILTKLATGHITLQIETDAIEFPTTELQEQVKEIIYLNIVVSRLLTHILQSLQMGMLHEIRIRGEEAH